MPAYKTPLPGILAAMLESGINRVLAMDENTPNRLQRLDDRMLQLDIEGIGITLYFAFNGQQVEVGTQSEFEPDTVISGSPMALFSMALPDEAGYWGTPESRVRISGDANLARDLERLVADRAQARAGLLRVDLADHAHHLGVALLNQGGGLERLAAGDQFIEQHTQ